MFFGHWTRCNNSFNSTIYALRNTARLMWKNDQISSSKSILARFQAFKWVVYSFQIVGSFRIVHSEQDPVGIFLGPPTGSLKVAFNWIIKHF